jgi:hypothetical protein
MRALGNVVSGRESSRFFLASGSVIDYAQPRCSIEAFPYQVGMAWSALQSWARPFAAGVLALAVLGWCAPSRSAASCGDYLTMTPGHGQPSGHDSMVPSFTIVSQRTDAQQTNSLLASPIAPIAYPELPPCQRCPQEPGKPPCRGPWCSGGPEPLPVPPSTAEQPQEQWAYWWLSHIGADHRRIALYLLSDTQDRVHHVLPIYHPPRPI